MIDKDLLKYIKERIYLLVLIVLLSLFALTCSVSFAFCLSKSIELFINKDITTGFLFIGIAVILALLFAFFTIIKNKLCNSLADFVSVKIRNDIYNKYVSLDGESKLTSQEISQLSSEGIEQLRLYYSSYLPSFFYAIIASISLFVLFLFFSYKVALVYLVCIPLIPISIILVSKWAKKIFAIYWNKYLSLGGGYLDALSGMKELLIFNYDKKMLNEMKENSSEFRKITMKVLVMQLCSTTIMDLVAYLGAGIGIIFTLIELNNGNINYSIALFMSLIGAEFFLPLRALGSSFHIAMNGATAGKKVISLLNEEEYLEGEIFTSSIEEISLKNVSYKYKDSNDYILNNINMSFKKGFISLLGASGSGKSTIAKILSSQLKEYSGSILIGDNELKNLNRYEYRKHVCYLSSESYLLNLPIIDAFHFYNKDIDENKIYQLLSLVSLKERFDNDVGLNYTPKEDSSNLSGGEKQRLLLAYYLSTEKDFYIFDEVTSNIDKDSEEILLKQIKKLSNNHIVLFISHRYKNALNADYIYLFDNNGNLKCSTLDELIKNDLSFKNQIEYENKCEELL